MAQRSDGNLGILFAFEYDPTLGWIESQQILAPPLFEFQEARGFQMWMQGDHLFVTSRYARTTGRLLYYHHDGTQWQFVSSHFPPGVSPPYFPMNFGWSLDVSLEHGLVVVGANDDHGPGAPLESGSAYVFRLIGDGTQAYQVQFEQRLLPPYPRDNGEFGGDCAIFPGGRVGVVCWGLQGTQAPPSPRHFLYVFDRTGAQWSIVDTWTRMVSMQTVAPRVRSLGDKVYLGASGWLAPGQSTVGAIVAFCEREGFWNVGGVLWRPPNVGTFFGTHRFALGDDFLVVGASDWTPPGQPQHAGGAVVYPLVTESQCLRSTYSTSVCTAASVGCPGGGLPSDPLAGCVNSTGRGGRLIYQGLYWRTFPTGRMLAYDLPPGSWVLFLRGLIPTTGSAWNPAGQGPLGAGTTCIINPVGSAYPVRPIAMDGSVEWLNPLGTGPGMDAQWGDLFSFRDVPFQAWYRDVDASGAATSNLTNVALVTMRQE